MVQNSTWPLCRSDRQLQEDFGWSYCCQRRAIQLLNPRVPPWTVKVYMLCSVKEDWLRWRSEHILWPIYAEIQVFPRASHTFSCMMKLSLFHAPDLALRAFPLPNALSPHSAALSGLCYSFGISVCFFLSAHLLYHHGSAFCGSCLSPSRRFCTQAEADYISVAEGRFSMQYNCSWRPFLSCC